MSLPDSDERRFKFSELFKIIMEGCGRKYCKGKFCKNNPCLKREKDMTQHEAAALCLMHSQNLQMKEFCTKRPFIQPLSIEEANKYLNDPQTLAKRIHEIFGDQEALAISFEKADCSESDSGLDIESIIKYFTILKSTKEKEYENLNARIIALSFVKNSFNSETTY